MQNRWCGAKPDCCELCKGELKKAFVDGRTKAGFWAIMCLSCHKEFGVGLGTGKGQKYSVKTLKKL